METYQFLSGLKVDVSCFQDIATDEDCGTAHTSHDVGSSSLEEGFGAFGLDNLAESIDGTGVFDSGTRGHHHSPSNGIDWVSSETSNSGDGPSEDEAQESVWLVSQKDWFQGIVESKVHTSVDEDSDARDDESSVKTGDTVSSDGLLVAINQTVELSGTVLGFGIVGHSGSDKVQTVDEHERQRTSETTGGDVGGEFLDQTGIFWAVEDFLDGIFEGKVQSLGWEVSDDVSQVSSPESSDTFSGGNSFGAVNDSGVWLVESTGLHHLVLVLDVELNSLDWSGACLGDAGGDS